MVRLAEGSFASLAPAKTLADGSFVSLALAFSLHTILHI